MAEWVEASLYLYSTKQVRIPVKSTSRSERAACFELGISLRGRSGPLASSSEFHFAVGAGRACF